MSPLLCISRKVEKLKRKYRTSDPRELCDALDIHVSVKDLGSVIKAYYFCQSRIGYIALNSRVAEPMRRIFIAHELGHDRLHKKIAMLKGFQEIELFDMARPAEYEANIFAAELLIDDKELLELLNDEDKSFFGVARELDVPAALLDFKFRVFKNKGYRIEAPYIANGDFLKDIDGCFVETGYKELSRVKL